MSTMTRIKAEERYAEIQKRDTRLIRDTQSESQRRIEKSARLRELRLVKEAEAAVIEDMNASGKNALKARSFSSN